MRMNRVLALGASALMLLSAAARRAVLAPSAAATERRRASLPRRCSARAAPPAGRMAAIRIGSDNFYESELMGEIYAQVLEAAGYPVERKFGLGSRQERDPDDGLGRGRPRAGVRRFGHSASTTRPRSPATARPTRPHCRRSSPRRASTVLGDHPGRGHQRVRRPQGHVGHAEPDQDEPAGRGPGPAQVGSARRLRHEPAVRGRARAVRHHLSAQAARGPRRVRRPDGPGARGQGHRHRRAVLDPAGDRAVRLHLARGRPRHAAGREHRPARPR